MPYKSIHTKAGLELLAAAEATGQQIRLTEIAIGDGGGNDVEPDPGMTNLVRERFRAPINRIWQHPDSPTMYSAEVVIPASAGGFVMRESAIFDANGTMFVVGNLPATPKPVSGEGAFSDVVLRIDFMVSNADSVVLIADPNVVVVTQTWVHNNVTPAMLIPGGTARQVLHKKSNADGDIEWTDPTTSTVVVTTVEETQTLAASQTIVDWTVVNNTGLAVYVDGARLRADEYTKHATIATRITLAKSYAAGAKIIGVQNEPAGSLPDPLVKGQNLADVPDKAKARTALDVNSKAETRQMAPPGLVANFARSSAPTGWLRCNGAAISRTAYAELFAAIGTTFGQGDGATSFNVPDLRGEFIRCWDDGRGVDAGRAFGSPQGDQIGAHSHSGSAARYDQNAGHTGSTGMEEGKGRPDWEAIAIGQTGGNETRPRNRALLACIKY